jgi:hypothetical protein
MDNCNVNLIFFHVWSEGVEKNFYRLEAIITSLMKRIYGGIGGWNVGIVTSNKNI